LKDSNQILKLIADCKRNNQKAQLKVYELYYKAMFNTAYRIVNDFDDAEDVMQEAFIKAFDKINSYQSESTYGAWLKKIVVNEALGFLRKNKKFKNVGLELLDKDMIEEPTEEIDFSKIQVNNVLKALREIKENYRIIISLYYIEGYDFEEIQEIMQISYANARTMLSRAKAKLKQKLVEEYGFSKKHF